MGDLALDTAVEALGDGRYSANISRDWNLWGPVGGYLAGIALRAAGAESVMPFPASLSCHYLSPAKFGPVDVTVRSLRRSRRAESLEIRLEQDGSPVASALVWALAGGLPGPEAAWLPGPKAPPPCELDRFDPAVTMGQEMADNMTYWRNVDIRQVYFEGESREPGGEPMLRSWEKYLPRSTFGDPWTDACRELISIDVAVFPAAAKGFPVPSFVAPSLDLYVAFHAPAPQDEYLLIEARGAAAGAGLLSGHARIWSADGTLAASGTSQLLCRMF